MKAGRAKQMSPTGIRLPPDIRDWLRRSADENSRSLNQEILHRLKLARAAEQRPGAA
jgi:hypothetical protein